MLFVMTEKHKKHKNYSISVPTTTTTTIVSTASGSPSDMIEPATITTGATALRKIAAAIVAATSKS
jgi:hypothetical protein